MTALGASADESAQAGAAQFSRPVEIDVVEVTEAVVSGPLAGDPAALGLPSFILGAVALGLTLVGVVPAAAVGAPLAIILAATAMGLVITTIWAAAVGQTAVAAIFGIFAAFWMSYAALVFGLLHNWFGITATAVAATEEVFLITWLIIVLMLTLSTLHLPVAFTSVFVLVALTVVFVLLGVEEASAGLSKAGGYFLLAAAAGGGYLFFNSLSQASGGGAVPLGKPLLRG
jgi:succinate-acetate transporter protein